jgi:hypothetical protein
VKTSSYTPGSICPPFKSGTKTPLSPDEFDEAISEVASWSRLQHFDPYFCAGEMMAAFCEVLRHVLRRSQATSSTTLAQILSAANAFADRLVFQIIDDSNGDHVFADAHLRELYRVTRARLDAADTDPTLAAVVRALEAKDREREESG